MKIDDATSAVIIGEKGSAAQAETDHEQKHACHCLPDPPTRHFDDLTPAGGAPTPTTEAARD